MAKLAKFVKEELINELCRMAESEAAKSSKGSVEKEVRKLEGLIWSKIKPMVEPFIVPSDPESWDKFERQFCGAPSRAAISVREPGSYRELKLTDEVTSETRVLMHVRTVRLKAGTKEAEALEKIFRLKDDLKEERDERRREIAAVVNSLNTHKQVEEVMPEFYEVLCQLGHGPREASTEYLPAVKRENLAKMCGLPPKKQ